MKYWGEDWTTIQLGRLHEAFHLAKDHMRSAREKNKEIYDKRAVPSKIEIGMPVWYHHPALQQGPATKLTPVWHPFYRVVAFKTPVNAVIRHQPSGETRTVHVNHLRPANPEVAWDKMYSTPEHLAAKRPPLWSYPTRTDPAADPVRTYTETPEASTSSSIRRQPMRSCRLATPDYRTIQPLAERPNRKRSLASATPRPEVEPPTKRPLVKDWISTPLPDEEDKERRAPKRRQPMEEEPDHKRKKILVRGSKRPLPEVEVPKPSKRVRFDINRISRYPYRHAYSSYPMYCPIGDYRFESE